MSTVEGLHLAAGSARSATPAAAPPDQEARERIVRALDRSILVEAGSGSGKTTSLVDRMVALVSTGTAKVDEIAAVTFTRKAAAELREKFQEALEAELSGLHDPAVHSRLDLALRHIDRGFTGTVHAFCARLLRERPIEAGLDPGFQELTGPEEREVRREFWLRHLDRQRQSGEPLIEELAAAGLRPDDLYDAYGTVSENPDVEFPADEIPPPDPADVAAVRGSLEELLERVLKEMPEEEPEGGWDALQSRINELVTSRRVYGWTEDIRFLEALAELLERPRGAWQSRWGGGKLGKERVKRWGAAFEDFCREDGPARAVLDRFWAHRYEPAMRFAKEGARAYEQERIRTGRLTFQDLLMRAAALLRESQEARRDLGRRFRFLLVDEFQDTDPIQAEVLFLLACGDPAENDWRSAVPRPGALFVVGDPKQSIYRFRRADIAVYGEVRERFREFEEMGIGEIVRLTANFRSRDAIAGFVNAQFDGAFPASPTLVQAAFAPMHVSRSDSEGGAVLWYEIECERDNQAAIAGSDAAALATWIRQRIDGGDRPKDFLVLPYLRRHLSVYARALEARGIPVQVTGADILIEEEIHELRLLLSALVDPDNTVLTAAVLVGLFFGLDYERLVQYRLAGGRFRFHREPPDESSDVGRALARMRAWWLLARRAPADVAVSTIVDELGLLPYAAAGELAGARAGSLTFLLDTVRSLGLEGRTSLRNVLQALDAVLELGEAETPLEPGRADVVRVMNLHRAKGTEAPIVVLAHPTGDRDWEPRKRVDRDKGSAIGTLRVARSFGRYAFRVVAQPLEWRADAEREREFEEAEAVRLLYVAVTRARDELVVARFRKTESKSVWQPLYGRLEASGEKIVLEPRDPPPRPAAMDSPEELARGAATIAERRSELARPTYRARSVTDLVKEGIRLEGRGRGRDWGSAVHQALESAVAGVRGEALARLCRAALLDNDRPTRDGEPAELEELVALAGRVADSELLRRARSADTVLHEVPFALPRPAPAADGAAPGSDGAPLEIVEGVIDLAFREAGGWVIADYKTDVVEDEAILEARRALYRAQVDLYADCWERLTGERVVERALFFTAIPELDSWGRLSPDE